jgi:hypothetical protein
MIGWLRRGVIVVLAMAAMSAAGSASAGRSAQSGGEILFGPLCDYRGDLADGSHACFVFPGKPVVAKTQVGAGDASWRGGPMLVWIEPWRVNRFTQDQDCSIGAALQKRTHHLPWSGAVKYSDSFTVPSGREYGLCLATGGSPNGYGYPVVTKKRR